MKRSSKYLVSMLIGTSLLFAGCQSKDTESTNQTDKEVSSSKDNNLTQWNYLMDIDKKIKAMKSNQTDYSILADDSSSDFSIDEIMQDEKLKEKATKQIKNFIKELSGYKNAIQEKSKPINDGSDMGILYSSYISMIDSIISGTEFINKVINGNASDDISQIQKVADQATFTFNETKNKMLKENSNLKKWDEVSAYDLALEFTTEGENSKVYNLGNTASLETDETESYDFTIKEAKYDKTEKGDPDQDYYPDGHFIKVVLNVKNTGKSAEDVMLIGESKIIVEDGTEYNSIYTGFQPLKPSEDGIDEIKPGLEKEVYATYNVPKDFEINKSKLVIETVNAENENKITFSLKSK